jgi:hypothetical protein
MLGLGVFELIVDLIHAVSYQVVERKRAEVVWGVKEGGYARGGRGGK